MSARGEEQTRRGKEVEGDAGRTGRVSLCRKERRSVHVITHRREKKEERTRVRKHDQPALLVQTLERNLLVVLYSASNASAILPSLSRESKGTHH